MNGSQNHSNRSIPSPHALDNAPAGVCEHVRRHHETGRGSDEAHIEKSRRKSTRKIRVAEATQSPQEDDIDREPGDASNYDSRLSKRRRHSQPSSNSNPPRITAVISPGNNQESESNVLGPASQSPSSMRPPVQRAAVQRPRRHSVPVRPIVDCDADFTQGSASRQPRRQALQRSSVLIPSPISSQLNNGRVEGPQCDAQHNLPHNSSNPENTHAVLMPEPLDIQSPNHFTNNDNTSPMRNSSRNPQDYQREGQDAVLRDRVVRPSSGPQMVTITAEEYNSLKSEIAGGKRLVQELVDSLKEVKQKCKQLEHDKNKLIVSAQCAATPPSSLKLSCANGGKGVNQNRSFRQRLVEELVEQDAAPNLVKFFQEFLEKITKYTHEYTSELVNPQWERLQHDETLPWAPNESADNVGLIRDWRGRAMSMEHFEAVKFPNKDYLRRIGAPLLQLGPEDESDNVEVLGAFVPLCPFEESRHGTMYTSTVVGVSNYICQAIISLINDSVREPVSTDVEKSVFKLASNNKILSNRFDYHCRQVMSTRKRSVKDVFFSSLGYVTISATKGKGSPPDFYDMRAAEEAEAYKKLVRFLSTDDSTDGTQARDTSYWRMASFEDICMESSVHRCLPLRKVKGVDKLFKNEAARRAYEAFRKFRVDPDEETSVLSVIRLDAIMTTIIDGFKSDSSRSPILSPIFHSPTDEHTPSDTSLGSNEAQDNRKGGKGGRVPVESMRKFRALMPKAAALFIQQVHELFYKSLSFDRYQHEKEFSVGCDGTETERLRNSERLYTVAFRYPANRHLYIALTQYAFAEHVCSWIGNVTDCFLLHSNSLNAPFSIFKESDVLHRIDEQDEDVIVSVPVDLQDQVRNQPSPSAAQSFLDRVDDEVYDYQDNEGFAQHDN